MVFGFQALKAMWNTLKLDPNPEMMANFEEVLSKLTGDVQKKTAEQETLENTIRFRTSQQQVFGYFFQLSPLLGSFCDLRTRSFI